MALVNCKECGSRISDKAPACVHCGAPLPTSAAAPAAAAVAKKKTKPKALWLGLLIVGAAFIFGWTNGLEKEFEKISTLFTPPKTEAIAPVPAAISVNAIQLFKDYKANKVSADLNYKGKNLLVNGVVDSINKNIPDSPFVAISGGGPAKTVRAQFQKTELPKLSALKRGQKITVACTGDSMLTGSPLLKGCTISGPKMLAAPPL
jgi:hypothetical protein